MINQKGFKKSLKHALLSSSLFIFFKSEFASETEVIGIMELVFREMSFI